MIRIWAQHVLLKEAVQSLLQLNLIWGGLRLLAASFESSHHQIPQTCISHKRKILRMILSYTQIHQLSNHQITTTTPRKRQAGVTLKSRRPRLKNLLETPPKPTTSNKRRIKASEKTVSKAPRNGEGKSGQRRRSKR